MILLTEIAKRIEKATREHGFYEEDVNEQNIADRKKMVMLYNGYKSKTDYVTALSKARLCVITDILCESLDGSVNTDPTNSDLLS